MIVFPAMDLLAGRVVKLDARHREAERDYGDPSEVAERWISEGAGWLHVVDLDAAFGGGTNDVHIDAIRSRGVRCQAGGGVRDEARVERLATERVVVGTRAIREPEWLGTLARRFPGRLVVAVDAIGLRLVVEGWQAEAGGEVRDYWPKIAGLPLAGCLYTNVGVEGKGAGVDWTPVREVIASAPHPVIVSGGISSLEEISRIRELGAGGVVVGSALYSERFTFAEAARAAR